MSVHRRCKLAGEIQNYFSNNVWDFAGPLSDDVLTTVVACRWVLVWKTDEATGLPKANARLVLRGFQDPDVANMSTASPTAGRTARQILLRICGQESWILTSRQHFCQELLLTERSLQSFQQTVDHYLEWLDHAT